METRIKSGMKTKENSIALILSVIMLQKRI